MQKTASVAGMTAWQVISTRVQTRDGPHRLVTAYQILLAQGQEGTRRGRQASSGGATTLPQEDDHADRGVRPRVHGTAGAGADD